MAKQFNICFGWLGIPLFALLLALPAHGQIEPTVPIYPSRKRYEEDVYRKVTQALRDGDEQYLVDWINADPIVCRAALLRMLGDPASDPTSARFASLFPKSSVSTIEEALVDFVDDRPPDVRRRTLAAFDTLNDLYIASRRTNWNDELGRRVASEMPKTIENIIQVFDQVGFELGRAEALLFQGRFALGFSSDILPDVLDEAIGIFQRRGNVAGQFQALIRLASFHYFEAWDVGDDERAAVAKALIKRYTDLIVATNDPLLQVYLALRQEEGKPEDQWPSLRAMPGLPYLKTQILLWLGETNETYLQELDRVVAGVQDRALLGRIQYLIATHFYELDDSRAFRYFAEATGIAAELGYDISAFDSPESRDPPVAAVVAIGEQHSDALKGGLQFEEARKANIRAIGYLESTVGLWTEDQLAFTRPVLLYRLAQDYGVTGDYQRAIGAGTKALDSLESNGTGHLARLVARHLSGIYGRLGDFESAQAVITRARAIPYDSFDFTSIMMAESNFRFARYDEALRWIAIAEEEKPDFVDSKRSFWATVRLRLLALIWLQLGEPDKALAFARELENRDPTHWMDRGVLGEVLIALRRYDQAKAYYQTRLKENRGRNRKGVVRDALKNLGWLNREAGEYERAIGCLSEGLALARTQGARIEEQGLLEELAAVELARGRREPASSLLEQSLEIATGSSDFEGIWTCHFYLGIIAEQKGERPKAISHYRAAVEAVEAVAGHVAVEAYHASFLQDKTAIYDHLIGLLGPTEPKEAFHYAERRRAQSFLDSVRSRGFRGGKPTERSLRLKDDLETELIGKQSALRDQMSAPLDKRDRALVSRLEKELVGVREKHAEVTRLIVLQRGSGFRRRDLIMPIRAEDVQSRILKQGQVLVEYVVSDDAIHAFVLTPSDCHYFRLFGDRTELAADVARLLAPFRQLGDGSVDLLHLDFDVGGAHQIYQKIFEPLEPRFSGAEELLIVADDTLHFLPFEALARSPALGRRDRRTHYAEYASVDWLVRHYTVSYALSATSLDPRMGDSRPVPPRMLAFAEPLAGADDLNPRPTPLRGSRQTRALLASLAPLPRAVEEVQTVKRLMKNRLSVTALTGAEATETAYLKNAGGAGYLHFAVHSLVDETYPEYSTLVLSRDAAEDGFLQTFELADAPLHAELVVLSACETGLGRLYRSEGLLGLKKSFLGAGARAVVVSLWSVEDSITDFVAEFYQRLERGADRASALRDAKLAYMKSNRPLGGGQTLSLSHPVFWAPMTITVASVQK